MDCRDSQDEDGCDTPSVEEYLQDWEDTHSGGEGVCARGSCPFPGAGASIWRTEFSRGTRAKSHKTKGNGPRRLGGFPAPAQDKRLKTGSTGSSGRAARTTSTPSVKRAGRVPAAAAGAPTLVKEADSDEGLLNAFQKALETIQQVPSSSGQFMQAPHSSVCSRGKPGNPQLKKGSEEATLTKTIPEEYEDLLDKGLNIVEYQGKEWSIGGVSGPANSTMSSPPAPIGQLSQGATPTRDELQNLVAGPDFSQLTRNFPVEHHVASPGVAQASLDSRLLINAYDLVSPGIATTVTQPVQANTLTYPMAQSQLGQSMNTVSSCAGQYQSPPETSQLDYTASSTTSCRVVSVSSPTSQPNGVNPSMVATHNNVAPSMPSCVMIPCQHCTWTEAVAVHQLCMTQRNVKGMLCRSCRRLVTWTLTQQEKDQLLRLQDQ